MNYHNHTVLLISFRVRVHRSPTDSFIYLFIYRLDSFTLFFFHGFLYFHWDSLLGLDNMHLFLLHRIPRFV